MKWFKCKHPWVYLAAEKAETVSGRDDEFTNRETHMRCMKCGEYLVREFCTLSAPVKEWLSPLRGRR